MVKECFIKRGLWCRLSFRKKLEDTLKERNLTEVGNDAGKEYSLIMPKLSIFASRGEGGFVINYGEFRLHGDGKRIRDDTYENKAGATITPIGATRNLIETIYEKLSKISQENRWEISISD